ncbi:MAG: hypothetical protein Q7U57_18840 [Methylovulum sp.]|nr:hypothetical protein [Methylovulum sp.]
MTSLQKRYTDTVFKQRQRLFVFGFLLLTNGQITQAATVLKLSAYPVSQQIILKWGKVTGASAYTLCYATESIKDMNACTSYANGIQKITKSNK